MSMTTYDPFLNRFPDDPECIRTMDDVEAFERVSESERFPCRSPLDAIREVVARFPEATALTFLATGRASDQPQRWTYTQYWEEITACANLFHAHGLCEETSVAFLLPNVPEMLFGFWGAELAGIAAPINHFLDADTIADIAQAADAHILVTLGDAEHAAKALKVQRLAPCVKHVFCIGDAPTGTTSWAEALAGQPHDRLTFERRITGTETAAYFHTGGTTGVPKLARHTHRAQAVNVGQMDLTGPSEANSSGLRSVILCGLPLFHVNAVFVSALMSIVDGGELILAGSQGFREKGLIEDFWQLVERHCVTFFAGVPTVYTALLEQPSEGYDLSSLSHCSCGGAPMPASLLRAFRERTGADVMEGYGMTETTVCATTHAFHGPRNIGSIGMRLPYTRLRTAVINADGSINRDCKRGEIGVLLVSGPNVIAEYKQADANANAWPEPGWLNTGDMARIDEEGYVWLTGRSKDLIIRGGHNIDPLITEDALAHHPDVDLVAAVGKPDAYAGELPIAYVTLRPSATVTADALNVYAREHAAERAAAPAEVVIVDSMPRTAVGKITKTELRKDAIARAYRERVNAVLPGLSFDVDVVNDRRSGQKVLVRTRSDGASLPAPSAIRERLASELGKLIYPWELVLDRHPPDDSCPS